VLVSGCIGLNPRTSEGAGACGWFMAGVIVGLSRTLGCGCRKQPQWGERFQIVVMGLFLTFNASRIGHPLQVINGLSRYPSE
jgi:hypothetical protein